MRARRPRVWTKSGVGVSRRLPTGAHGGDRSARRGPARSWRAAHGCGRPRTGRQPRVNRVHVGVRGTAIAWGRESRLTTPHKLRPEARRRKATGRRSGARWRPKTDGRGRQLHAVVRRQRRIARLSATKWATWQPGIDFEISSKRTETYAIPPDHPARKIPY